MASSDMKLTLVLTGRDDGAKRLLEQTKRETERMAQSRATLSRANRPYAIAGIRSEREIRREIAHTQAAYNRLAASGRASHNDLARAAVATKNKISALNAELNQGLQTQSRFGQALGKIGRFGASATAGGMAAYATVSPELDRYKTLDYRLRETTWAAYGEEKGNDTAFLEGQGLAEIRGLIKELVNKNGGSTDLAIDTVQGMLANGLSWEQVKKDVNATHNLAKAAGENGQYDGAAAAKLAKVFADNGFDVERASQMAMQSGMQGTFEIADMVRELPSLLPDAKAAGFTGEAGLAYLLSSLQSASNKAGSTSEAANNVKNALQKALSADTTKRMDKILSERGASVDWQQMVLEGQRENKNAMQVLGDFAQKLLSEDKDYQAAKKRADGGDEAAKQEMATMQAFMISRLLPDMQARAGLNAMIDQKQMAEYYAGLMGNPVNMIGDKNRFLNNSAFNQQEKAQALKEMALQESKTFESLAEVETAFKGLAAEFPVATEAFKALTAAVTASTVAIGAMSLLGKGKGLLAGGAGGASGAAAKAGVFSKAGSAIKQGASWLGNGLRSAGSWAGNGVKTIAGKVFSNPRALGVAGLALHSSSLNDPETDLLAKIQLQRRKEQALSTAKLTTSAVNLSSTALSTRSAAPTTAKPIEPPEKLSPLITQQTTTYQTALAAQSLAFQTALQADTAEVGSKLDAINGTLSGLQQTIQLTSTLNLDGRIIANEVSRHAVAMFGRGAGQ